MKYLTIKETAVRWGISERTVNKLCAEGRVEGAEKFGSVWSIPEDAEKPIDPRKLRKLQAEAQTVTEEIEPIIEKTIHIARYSGNQRVSQYSEVTNR